MQHFIVPVDGSTESWRAVDVALGLARRCRGHIEIVEVVFDAESVSDTERRLVADVEERDVADVDFEARVLLSSNSVAGSVAALVEEQAGAMVVMASSGRGRSAAIVGSVAEDLLRRLGGPIVVVGSQAQVRDFSGPIVVTVDGSDLSEAALPVAAAWSLELGAQPWVVEVIEPKGPAAPDSSDADYVERLARLLSTLSASSAEHRVLRARGVAPAVAEFVDEVGASIIVASTHGRTAAPRFVLGSTTASLVQVAPCPLLLVHPQFG